ncbi:DEAD/DEAH box helicase [Xanthomonas arboricola]|uniref:DEAD/DEAH box helicase n=1 Tax=Xanthomonas arboricola TaxID=56448 RepID=UPI000CEE24E7|nr:DEAD/DEAH box helicase [Xanthomonas arboricola]PPT41771.1 DEAD/DEAH box helicase [Xanthomonas arboricola]
MRASLQQWINNADVARHLRHFQVAELPIQLGTIDHRLDDYYISLVGELFANLHNPQVTSLDWAQLGNAFLQFSSEISDEQLRTHGIAKGDAALFASASFYFGDFPASAYLAMRRSVRPSDPTSLRAACYDFLARPGALQSDYVRAIQEELKDGALGRLSMRAQGLREFEVQALEDGPEEWIMARLLSRLFNRFLHTNVRTVLPDGEHPFWTPLVHSLVNRQPSNWEFFPSQIQAIQGGLLGNDVSYSMQMPTGAGKTTLCETLIYWHLSARPQEVALLLVPFRSLASELRGTLVNRLNAMGLPARCAYGGTVPTGDEVHGLDRIRAMVATPEALSGILSADARFAQRVSLVICDEGHLLDGGSRGIGLELLLARMKSRPGRPPRFVFVSAIVPNIEEINAWLGGNEHTVIRSTYRPATVEYAVLRPQGIGASMSINLDVHPHEPNERRFQIVGFLNRSNFTSTNSITGRPNTYHFTSIKTQAVATARKVLPMGTTAIFAANKRGKQGAVGLAQELVEQLSRPLHLPKPADYTQADTLRPCIAYLEAEYGADWIGSQVVRHGAVLHHGDIPQESREVLEVLIREAAIRLVICTSTLAEGVNLPIRSLVLYSVQRQSRNGHPEAMLARDIKNLVGRAGRAGANTKGLVICANPGQWRIVQPVATQGEGEAVRGSLLDIIQRLAIHLTQQNLVISNEFLENVDVVHPIVDGVDSTLIDLISEEVGEDVFVARARQLAEETFAARQLPHAEIGLLRTVFELRARRLIGLRSTGQLAWVRDTGTKVRMLESVAVRLRPARADWKAPVDPLDDGLRTVLLEWAWSHRDLQQAVVEGFRLPDSDAYLVRDTFFDIVRRWMLGETFSGIAQQLHLEMDQLLAIHTRAITFTLQTLVEQGVSLLARILQADGLELAVGVSSFTEQLRFGAPNYVARWLAAGGVRHRRAYVLLGKAIVDQNNLQDQRLVKVYARNSLNGYADAWRAALGELVYTNTVKDLS